MRISRFTQLYTKRRIAQNRCFYMISACDPAVSCDPRAVPADWGQGVEEVETSKPAGQVAGVLGSVDGKP